MKRSTYRMVLKVLSVIFLILLVKVLVFSDPFSGKKIESIILYILSAVIFLGWMLLFSKNKKPK